MAKLSKDEITEKWKPHFMPRWWYGIGIGEGWYDLLDDALESMCSLLEENGFDRSVLGLHQIKEKFGGLRIYWCPNLPEDQINDFPKELWDEMEALATEAESMSFKVCDECASMENVTVGSNSDYGWIVTMCKDCRSKKQRTEPS